MNSKLFRQCIGTAVGLAMIGGCAKPAHTAPQPVVSAVRATTVVAPSGAAPGDAQPPPNEETPRIEQRVPPSQPANLSPGVQEIVKLAQAGVSEETMLTYIERYPGNYSVTADQIVYLNDLGVSTTVVNAMMKHDGNTAVAQNNAPQSAPQPNYASAPPQYSDVPIATAPATPTEEVSYFYDSLAPYGSWIYVSGYGWCWQPTVAVTTATWAPYSDRGRWYWSDAGWYWQSDYTWGWAAFHYGRWYRHPRCGWVWTPGTVWGPAWVSWRYSDAYCGWAPLPPRAVFVAGHGFTYYGRHVAVGFDFGLSFHHYTFVSTRNFCDPHPYRHRVRNANVVNIYNNTTVINNYNVRNGNVINNGVGRERIARHTQNDIRTVKVQQASFATANDRMNKMERRGNDLVVYRPQLPKEPPVKPSVVQNRMAQQAQQARETTRARNRDNDNVPAGTAANAGRDNRRENIGRSDNVGRNDNLGARNNNAAGRSETVGRNENRAGNDNGASAVAPRASRNDDNRAANSGGNNNGVVITRRDATPAPVTPQVEPRNNRPERGNGTRQTPNQAPQTVSPRGNEAQNNPRVERRYDSPRVQTAPSTPQRVYPETRYQVPSAAPTAPLTPSQGMSPRYNEQIGGHAGRQVTPNYSAPRPSGGGGGYSAPRGESHPSVAGGGGGNRGGGGGGRGDGGGGGRGDGGGRGNRN